jgi:HD superfamily phosphohydrolase YqeK
LLQNKICYLENKLEEERKEHRDIYMKLKNELRYTSSSSNHFDAQLFYLQQENQRLLEENLIFKEQLNKTT